MFNQLIFNVPKLCSSPTLLLLFNRLKMNLWILGFEKFLILFFINHDETSVEKTKLYKEKEVYLKAIGNRLHRFLKEDNTLLNGAIVGYHKNGGLRRLTRVKEGMLHGSAKFWFINGKLRTHENFRNNSSHLEQKYFDEQGNLIRIKEYYNGRRILEKVFYQNTKKWDERVFDPSYQFSLNL